MLTDNGTVDLVNHAGDDDLEDDNEVPEKADRMSHSEGLNSIETALAYVEQQREATATDVLLFRRWRDLAAKKRKEAQNYFLKKTLLFTNLRYVEYNFYL
jgi:enterochelin esterase-like enzyme